MAKAPAPAASAAKTPRPQGRAQPKKGDKGAPTPPPSTARPRGTGDVPARLKEVFEKTVRPALMKERGYTNLWQVPRLEKIVLNMGVGEGRDNAKVLYDF